MDAKKARAKLAQVRSALGLPEDAALDDVVRVLSELERTVAEAAGMSIATASRPWKTRRRGAIETVRANMTATQKFRYTNGRAAGMSEARALSWALSGRIPPRR